MISIIIPIYNVSKYILQCLESVANQTVTEGIECVLVDDCGTDNSIEIATKYIDNYQGSIEFKIIHHEKNKGLSAARNTGIRHAKGEYVYFLDSDDAITSECMAGFKSIIAQHSNVDLIQGLIDQDSSYMNQFVQKRWIDYTEDRRYIKKALLDYDELPVCAANKMVRRELLIEKSLFFKEGIVHEDNYWSFFLSKYIKSLAVYPQRCYIYTENPISITKKINLLKEILSFRIIIEDFCDNIDSFMEGEQKICILKNILQVLNCRYYETEQDKRHLLHCLYQQCTWYEKMAMSLWTTLPIDSNLRVKTFHLLIRLFKFNS